MNAAIIEDGVPNDLGQSGVGLISDESTETVYEFRWFLRDGRLVIEIGKRVSGDPVARIWRDSRLSEQDRRHV